MLTDERIRQIAHDAGFGGISDSDVELCRAVEAEATADLRESNERLRLEMQAACTSLCPHGLDIAAQKENAERRLREYEHHVMTGRSEQHDRLVVDNEHLRALLADIRAEGRITGGIAKRLIAALAQKEKPC